MLTISFYLELLKRPSLETNCRVIQKAELNIIIGVGSDETAADKRMYVGKMPLYDNYPISVKVNDFFVSSFCHIW